MTSMPESLSNNALLSSEVRRVLAACSKKQVELDKVKEDLARQQNDLDNRKLEIKAKQSKIDKHQQQIHKFEKWFLQVSLIECIERIGEATKLGPKSDTHSEGGSEEDSEGGSEVDGETDDEAEYETDDEVESRTGWNGCDWWDEPASNFQHARGDHEHSTHGPVDPDHVWPASCWGHDNVQSTNTTNEKNESPNNTVPIKTKSPIKTESSGKNTPTYKASDHNDVGVSTTWNDPTVASRISWSDPTAAPKLQQKDHNVQGTRNPSSLDRPGYPAVRKLQTFKKTLNWAKPVHNVDQWEQHNVGDSSIKATDVSKGDKSDQNMGYHWNDDQYKVDGSCTLRPRYNDRPRRPSSGLRHLDELTNKSVNNSAGSEQAGNAGESTNVDDGTIPSYIWGDFELINDNIANDKVAEDKATDVNEGWPNTEHVHDWSLSGHSSDADNLTTWGMPVVTPDSSKSGSGTCFHCISKGTSTKVKVEDTFPEEVYKDWHKYEDPRYKVWTTAEIDEYDAKAEAW